ncbi:formyltransferase family protein [Halomonas salifodinae]|uniref:Formyltransferase family protein n=1 Tax=Halomonas salifodinae TaxID=438745 RepID=A0ABW2F0F5_9GAMM
MKITLLCTNREHPVNDWLVRWQARHQGLHDIVLCCDREELPGGDILFLISCSQIVDAETRNKYMHTMVLHASDLPKGRGWSPHIWALLAGNDTITVSLLTAEDSVDTGEIWAKRSFSVPPHMLYDEINQRLFDTELILMDEAITLVEQGAKPVSQAGDVAPSYYRKRTPVDSEVDPNYPLSQLFNTIRVMDPQRFPAYFKLHGHTYTIEIKKVPSDGRN